MPIKIFIDQGHNPVGYHNSGAVANGLYESDINYEVGIYLQKMLNSDPRFIARVSRPTSTTVLGTDNATSLIERVNQANEWPADYFISIHCNSNPSTFINRTEIYIYQAYTQANWLAEPIMYEIVNIVGMMDNGIRVNSSLYVLRRTNMPAILIELGYLTNLGDAEKIKNEKCIFAFAIYKGLLDYFGFS